MESHKLVTHGWAMMGKDKTTVLFGGWAGSMDSEKMLHWLYEAGGAELWKQYRLENMANLYSLWNVSISIFTFKKASEEFRGSQRIEVETSGRG